MISGMKNNTKRILKNLFTWLALLSLWQISSVIVNKPVYFPSFIETHQAFYQLALTSGYWLMTGMSLLRVIGGFATALLIGVLMAVVCVWMPIFADFIKGLMGIAKATPVASFIILAMIWMHSTYVPVFVAILMIAPIIFENTLQGIKNIDQNIIEMSKVYTIPRYKFIKKIAVPYTKPYLAAAIFSSLGIGFKSVVSAEILSHPMIGIGTGIYDAKIYLNTPQLFSMTITVILLSLLLEKIMGKLLQKSSRVKYETGI